MHLKASINRNRFDKPKKALSDANKRTRTDVQMASLLSHANKVTLRLMLAQHFFYKSGMGPIEASGDRALNRIYIRKLR